MRHIALPLLAAVMAMPAHAEVLQQSDAGFIVRETVEVPADVWTSWAALTVPAKWWNPEHTWSGKADNLYIDSQATGCFCELMPVPDGAPEGTRRGSAEHMRIIQSNPGKVLRMSGALGPLQGEAVNAVLTVTLKPLPTGTRILWEYVVGGYMRFKPDEISKAVDGVLGEQLARLGRQLGAVDTPKPEAGAAAAKDGQKPDTQATGNAAAATATDGKEADRPAAKPSAGKPAAN